MIRNQQSIRADETARSAGIEANGGFLQVLQPGVRGVKLVTFAQKVARRLVEQPHAFVGTGNNRYQTKLQPKHESFHNGFGA